MSIFLGVQGLCAAGEAGASRGWNSFKGWLREALRQMLVPQTYLTVSNLIPCERGR